MVDISEKFIMCCVVIVCLSIFVNKEIYEVIVEYKIGKGDVFVVV